MPDPSGVGSGECGLVGARVTPVMLRTVLKLMLAIFLIVQGCGLAFGHDGHSARMHCHHVDEHGKPIRMPCCPHGCPSTGDACSAWAIAMIALPLSVLRSV